MAITSFKRIEKKYIVDEFQKQKLIEIFKNYMTLDPYCLNESTYHIQNIYYDTDSNTLISQSIAKPRYKQKLRARKYLGTKDCFLEIKKKCEGVVGKRRIKLSLEELDKFINYHQPPKRESFIDNQIIGEIEYLLNLYSLKPKVFISYDRLGFFDKNDREFRITFDNHIHTKANNFIFDKGDYQFSLLEDGKYVLEIKSNKNFPLWLVKTLSSLKIYSQSFSKYGTEYKKRLTGEINYEDVILN